MEAQENEDQSNKETRQKGSDIFQPEGPRDGHDNTGTQGYDSLKDDGYSGTIKKTDTEGHEDGTGSSSEDFTERPQ